MLNKLFLFITIFSFMRCTTVTIKQLYETHPNDHIT
jgi:hypothetical protein